MLTAVAASLPAVVLCPGGVLTHTSEGAILVTVGQHVRTGCNTQSCLLHSPSTWRPDTSLRRYK